MSTRAANTKKKILDSAQELVMDRGFSATSVDAIQAKAGISRGTFFYHFPTKDDLSRELIQRYADVDREFTDEAMSRAEKLVRDPVQQILVFISLHEEVFEGMDGLYPGCLFASYSYEAGLFDDATRDIVDDSVEHWRSLVGGKFAEAIEAHPPRMESDPVVLADLAYGILQGAFILSRLKSDNSIIIEHIRQLRNHVEMLFQPTFSRFKGNQHAASRLDPNS